MDLNSLKNIVKVDQVQCHLDECTESNDIAIIGMDAKIGVADSYMEFWDYLCKGFDFVGELSPRRAEQTEKMCSLLHNGGKYSSFAQCAYLRSIDEFDAGLFHISAAEAELMDPTQRLFLQSVWSCIQDAGYAPESLHGSKTGVFLGHSEKKNEYSEAAEMVEPEKFGVITSGNVASIISSRISYILDLKGPAVNIDTACSSSLVALHIACQEMRNGNIDMAIVGSARIMLTARVENSDKQLGIESSSNRTKTFNVDADGTGGGEGVISILLKPLKSAQHDRDNIYAVIKGSSINQDGSSIGLTAPNASAQAEVMVNAWKDAGIDPETISYIEAHGTATKLGDPTEIRGIQKAFRYFTEKKQFCAIGSVKANIGHLDCASGLAGILKCVLMLKNNKIPPLIHFHAPNREINFTDSPVYVNDKLTDWSSDKIRRCGISSFGISGTNCHVVLEQAEDTGIRIEQSKEYYIVTASGQSQETAIKILKRYQEYLRQNDSVSLNDFCYTANTGRDQLNYRIGMLFHTRQEFLEADFDSDTDNIMKGNYKITDRITEHSNNLITIEEQAKKTAEVTKLITSNNELNIMEARKLLLLFVEGANVPWNKLYQNESVRHISIPVYPFNLKKYWIPMKKQEARKDLDEKRKNPKIHPLVDELTLDTLGMQVFQTRMSVDTCWVLRYHKINGKYVLPGTAWIEMIQFAGMQYTKNERIAIHNLVFLVPLVCKSEDERIVHIAVKEEENHLKVTCYSRDSESEEWTSHAEAEIVTQQKQNMSEVKLQEIISCLERREPDELDSRKSIVEVEGEKFNSLKNIYVGESETLLDFSIDAESDKRKAGFYLYPPLLDPAINGQCFMLSSIYLPYSCKKATFYEPLPNKMFSYVRKSATTGNQDEFEAYNITLCNSYGKVVGSLEDYTIKKVHKPKEFLSSIDSKKDLYQKIEWIEYPLEQEEKQMQSKDMYTLWFGENGQHKALNYETSMGQVISIGLGNAFNKISEEEYELNNCQEDYLKLLDEVGCDKILKIVFEVKEERIVGFKKLQLNQYVSSSLKCLFFLVKALVIKNVRQEIEIIILTKHSTAIVEGDSIIDPMHEAIAGFGKCVNQEYSNLRVRVIDRDEKTDFDLIQTEMHVSEKMYRVAYRNNVRYVESLKKISKRGMLSVKKQEIQENGAYVITGGLGGIGLTFCRYLMSQNASAKVVLINRSYTQEEFKESAHHNNGNAGKKYTLLEQLWSEGKEVEIVKYDVTDYEQLSVAFQQIRDKYGSIKGIFHGAGIGGDGFIFRKDWNTFEDVLEPKVYGTWNLYNQVMNEPLDFFLMCSSYTSVFGSPGQSDYSAANAYMDSMAYYMRSQGIRSTVLNWTGWKESGMASGIDEKGMYIKFITDEEGMCIFDKCMELLNEPRILIGELDYSIMKMDEEKYFSKIMASENGMKQRQIENEAQPEENTLKNIVILGKSLDKVTETEKKVISAWVKTLGVQEINIHDKFFESGGNSLLASYLSKELNKLYPNMLAVTDIFIYSTVAEMAEYIEMKLGKEKKSEIDMKEEQVQEDDDISKLLNQFVNGEIDREKLEELLGE